MVSGLAPFLAALAVLGLSGNVVARTWYVAADGSGDAPTIDAAVDSSTAGDVILVGAGAHLIGWGGTGGIYLKAGTTLQSESGPALTTLLPYDGPAQPGMLQTSDGCAIIGFHIGSAVSGTIYAYGDGLEISGNIIESSVQTISVVGEAWIHHNVVYGTVWVASTLTYVDHNIILGRIAQCAGSVLVYCNDVTLASSCVSYGRTNFNLDPLFCGVDDYHLNAASPCAPGNHPNVHNECGLIGPLPVGCGTVSTKQTTWGAVKAMYRD